MGKSDTQAALVIQIAEAISERAGIESERALHAVEYARDNIDKFRVALTAPAEFIGDEKWRVHDGSINSPFATRTPVEIKHPHVEGGQTCLYSDRLMWSGVKEYRPLYASPPSDAARIAELEAALRLAEGRLRLLLRASLPESDHTAGTEYVLNTVSAALHAKLKGDA